MSACLFSSSKSCDGDSRPSVFGNPIWNLILGIIEIIVGVVALTWPFPASIGVSIGVGYLLAVVAIFQFFSVFQKNHSGLLWRILGFLGYGILAFLFFRYDTIALEILTIIVGFIFLYIGLSRGLVAWNLRPAKSWGWSFFNGLITTILGLLIIFTWPESTVWTLGVLIGVQLLFDGWSLVAISWANLFQKPQDSTKQSS